MICPKCGFEQPDGSPDCARCGIVFGRYRATPANGTILPVEPLELGSSIPPEVASPPPEPTVYGEPPPPAPQLYGDALPPPPPGLPGLHAGRPFELGAVLSETFQIYFANFLPFLLLTALAFAPVIVYEIVLPLRGTTPPAILLNVGVALLLRLLCSPLATAAITFGVFQQMRGRDTTISDSLRVGLSHLFPVLGVAVLQGLAVLLGLVFCIAPGIFAAILLAVAVPVAVEENPGTFAALKRSGDLTEGYRGHVFGILLVLGVIAIGASLVLSVAAIALAFFPLLAVLFRELGAIFLSGLSATATAVMYYRLRSVKESIDVESLASVFD